MRCQHQWSTGNKYYMAPEETVQKRFLEGGEGEMRGGFCMSLAAQILAPPI